MTANLKMVREAINHNTGIRCEIEHIYIDYGANWMEDAIVSVYPERYQVLNPRQVEEANLGILQMDELQKIIDEIKERGW